MLSRVSLSADLLPDEHRRPGAEMVAQNQFGARLPSKYTPRVADIIPLGPVAAEIRLGGPAVVAPPAVQGAMDGVVGQKGTG